MSDEALDKAMAVVRAKDPMGSARHIMDLERQLAELHEERRKERERVLAAYERRNVEDDCSNSLKSMLQDWGMLNG